MHLKLGDHMEQLQVTTGQRLLVNTESSGVGPAGVGNVSGQGSLDTIEQHHTERDCNSYQTDVFERQLHNLLLKKQDH